MADFLSDYLQIADDIPAGDNVLEPGRINWFHGTNKSGAKTPGVFYARATAFSTPPAEPWVRDDRFEDEEGYHAERLHLAVLGDRSQWFLADPNDPKRPPQWLSTYQEGAKKQTEYLVLVHGLEDPMVLSVSGKWKAGPILDIVSVYKRGLLTQASRRAKRNVPLWAFWLPIGTQLKDGKTHYIDAQDGNGKTYGSVVTPPAAFWPADPMNELYVGEEVLRQGAAVREQYADWFKARRLPAGVVEGEVIAPAYLALPSPETHSVRALPSGRNVPQPIDVDDESGLPF